MANIHIPVKISMLIDIKLEKMSEKWEFWEGKQVLRQRDEYKKGFRSVFENSEATNQLQMKWNKGIEI